MNSPYPHICPSCHQIDWSATLREVTALLTPSTATVPDFALAVSIDRAAEMAGVSTKTIREWARRGILPTTQIERGGRRLVRVAALDQFLRDREQGGLPWQPGDGSALMRPGKTRGRQVRKRD